MEYTTNDLSRILDVSTNTIRRYEEKGYLHAARNENNGYRQFTHEDVEKLMYVNKFRKVGFSHEEIADIFDENIQQIEERFREKMEELDRQIAYLSSLRHVVKDDIGLMHRVPQYSDGYTEFENSPVHYIIYQTPNGLQIDKQCERALHKFMSTCPEFEYAFFFDKEDVLNRRLEFSQGVIAHQSRTKQYRVVIEPPICSYERRLCLVRIVRLPIDITAQSTEQQSRVTKILFDDFLEYIEREGYKLIDDVMGVKIGMSREDSTDWQYVLMHYPIEKL